jgi:hypothetical protein
LFAAPLATGGQGTGQVQGFVVNRLVFLCVLIPGSLVAEAGLPGWFSFEYTPKPPGLV